MNEQIQWEKRDKLKFTEVIDSVNSLAKEYVKKEIKELNGKMEQLVAMGLIKDDGNLKILRDKIQELGI